MRARSAPLLLALLVAACGDKDPAGRPAPPDHDTGEPDGGATDSGEVATTDGGETDGGETDGGVTDGGETDGGETDGGVTDGGETDGGETDGGETDGGETDPSDLDGDGVAVEDDCDDLNPSVGRERSWYVDGDGDGFGDATALSTTACEGPDGTAADATDCDDLDAAVYPGAAEIVGDGTDQDCRPLPTELTGSTAAASLELPFTDHALAAGGDLDGDGISDGALGAYSAASPEGMVFIVPGAARGEAAIGDVATVLWGRDEEASGASVACVGDVTGDGLDDLLVGSPLRMDGEAETGGAWLVAGPVTAAGALADVGLQLSATDEQVGVGWAAARAGDTDGDGIADLLVGAPSGYASGEAGLAFLLAGPVSADLTLSDAATVLEGRTGGDEAGLAVASAGDPDGDGYGDVLVGAPADSTGGPDAGAAFLLLGPLSVGTRSLETADGEVQGSGSDSGHPCRHTWGDVVGQAVLGPGDIDGDGVDDIVVGTDIFCDDEDNEVGVYLGPLEGVRTWYSRDIRLETDFGGMYMGMGSVLADATDRADGGLAVLLLPSFTSHGVLLLTSPMASDEVNPLREARHRIKERWSTAPGISAASPGDVNGEGRPDVFAGTDTHLGLFLMDE